jgi:hypothetical protein
MSKHFSEEYSFVGREAKKDKRKRHTKGFSEDFQDKRAQRINFKKYIRELEEQELEDDFDDIT